MGAAAATVATIAGVAVGASANPAVAATARPSGHAATHRPGGAVAGAPVLAAPGGTALLAAPSLNDTALGKSAPLASPAVGGTHSPLARSAPAAHPQPQPAAQPSASPAAGGSATPGPGQSPGANQSSSAQAAPQQPYQFYDSVEPQAIPAGQIVATYVTGPFAVSQGQVAGRAKVLWIDTNGSDPNADALDTEPGDATPSMAASWAYRKLHANPNSLACIYTALGEWPAVQAATSALPAWMQSHIRWWIANPTGVPHLVPGSDATQWYWGPTYDISTAKTRL